MQICPLCHQSQIAFYHRDKYRDYWQCAECQLVFVDNASLPSIVDEKAEYDLHENNADDEGYIRFLNKLAIPLTQILSPGMQGLDFGCGPTPVLASLLTDAGMHMTSFDPIYHNTQTALNKTYDFITSTEAFEHFHSPGKEIKKLMSMLKPGGILAVMTKRVISKERFGNWHYKNDKTHVVFFSESTFYWLAKQYELTLTIMSSDVVFLRKPL